MNKARRLSMRRHARVSHAKNGRIQEAFIPYWNDHSWRTVQEKVWMECRKQGLKSPVRMIETGAGVQCDVVLY